MVTFRVVERVPGREIEAWSSVRLPFEPRGAMKDFRHELNRACRTLRATSGEQLHAVYSSDVSGLVDLENVMTYNLGTGAISEAARYGLVLERHFESADPADGGHHYEYVLEALGNEARSWKPGPTLGAVRINAPDDAFRAPKAGRWWLLARRAGVEALQHHHEVPDRYGLRIVVNPPASWRGSLATLLKPLADGLVSAMHAHRGPVDAITSRASTISPELDEAEFREHLTPACTPLGALRVVAPWRDVLQWLPADDHIVVLRAHKSSSLAPGTVDAAVYSVVP
jgi:hypothetical protein